MNIYIQITYIVIGEYMTYTQKRVTITLYDEDLQFFKEHSEISPSRLMRKAIQEYREKLGEEISE